ncbi:carboxyltransferase domain-containing protein [Paracoccus limosus]|uniref:Carboxyltransferase domain-containing protein n=1 Tax=Paracoccus limosus TaxID=913252 RepID=A0A844H5Q6_9RHOB|nr:allophanate hydrolase subunit 1 [Paracoccus limosus]MTH33658.1 carboxyltransferase domain-containing protein [Paracoccus limosus]
MTDRGFPVFAPIAEHSLLVEFGDRIDDAIHARVLDLDRALALAPLPGLVETVPSYAALLIRFDPLCTDHAAVEAGARGLLDRPSATGPGTTREVLVCYDQDLAPDLAEVARTAGMTPEAVIAAHLAGDYRVYMYGFAPGYAYMAGVPQPIRLPRKPAARRDVPAGSVLIAGPQCLVSTLTMPTGWWIIGRSPTRILTGDPQRPFLFDVGDRVRFRRIPRAVFEARP